MKSLRDEIFAYCKDEIHPQVDESDASYYAKHCFDDMQSVTDDMQAEWLDLPKQKTAL